MDLDPLGDAARKTEDRGSARILSIHFIVGATQASGVWERDEGVADFARRRAHLCIRRSPGTPLDELVQRVAERWPWLDDEEDDDEGEGEVVFAGASHYYGHAGWWTRFGDEEEDGPRNPSDPLFVLDALAAMPAAATRLGIEDVRETETTRYDTTIDLRAAAESTPDRVRRPSEQRPDRPWTMRANVWVDREGLVRRATSTILPVARPRAPGPKPTSHYWHTIELWDFALPVDIAIPTPDPPEPGDAWPKLLYDLWKRRRDYYRAHPKTRG